MPETERERLKRLVGMLPLDDVQLRSAQKGAEQVPEERAKELADRLQRVYDQLPAILDRLRTARERAAKRVRSKS